jgi:Rrf2 family protein
MLMSMQTDYALRVLLDIAANWPSAGVATRELAERQHVPRVFLTKIVAQLASNGFLRTQRGKGGGVMLGRNPEQINILDVVEMFEGRLRATTCTASEEACVFGGNCAIRHLWMGGEENLRSYLSATTLADLVERDSQTHRNDAALSKSQDAERLVGPAN